MAQVKRRRVAPQEVAATNLRTFRTFLLVQQFAAKEIGDRIRQARKERGLSQDDLAAMASFSKRSLQDYEAGVTIPYKHFREISRLLRRAQAWFLYGDEADEAEDPRLEAVLVRLERIVERIEAAQGE